MSTSIRQALSAHRLASWLVALFVLLGVLYSLVTPVFEASDERFHYPVVHHVATTGRLPVQVVGRETAWEQEGSQAPLYYGLAAALTAWIDTSDLDERLWLNPHAKLGIPLDADNKNMVIHTQAEGWPWRGSVLAVHLLRSFSLLLATGSVVFSYRLALEVPFEGERRTLALLAAALVAFNPMFLFISASVNNDNLIILLSTVTLWLLARILNDGLTRPRAAWLALLLGLSALTKLSGLTMLPLAGLVLLIHARRTGEWRASILAGIGTGVALLALTGWWFARNLRLYGELTGLNTMALIAGPRPGPVTFREIAAEWQGFWLAYWGLFGAVNILADRPVYLVYNLVFGVGVAGLAFWAFLRIRAGQWRQLLLPGLLLVQVLVVFAGLVRWTIMTLGSQGRLMFPMLGAISALLALGWLALFPGARQRLAAWAVGLTMLLVAAIIPFRTITPVYAAPPVVEAPPPGAIAVNARYGDALVLVAVETQAAVAQPGGSLPVTLYWRADQQISEDYSLFLHALGRETAEMGKVDAYPGAGRLPTSLMEPGVLIRDEYHIPLDEAIATPTGVRVQVGVWHYPTETGLPITGPDGAPLESVIVWAGSVVPKDPQPLAPPAAQEAVVGGFARLLGYGLDPQVAVPGEAVTLDLHWRALGPSPADHTVFVHLVDAAGDVLAQADAPPLQGDYPTTLWSSGVELVDTHALSLPAGLPPGDYTLLVGFYDPASPDFTRPAATGPGSVRFANDAIPLSTTLRVTGDSE